MTTKSEIQALSEAVDLLMVTISRQHAVMCWVMHSKLLLGLNWVQWALPETLHVPGLLLPTSFLIQPYILLKAGSALSSGDSTTSQGNLCHFLASWGNSPSCNPAWASLVSTTASSLFPPLHPTVKRLALSSQEHPCRTGQVAVGFLRALSPPGLISPAPSVSPHSACIPLLNSGHFVAGLCLQEKHGVMDEELEEHPKLCLTLLCPSECVLCTVWAGSKGLRCWECSASFHIHCCQNTYWDGVSSQLPSYIFGMCSSLGRIQNIPLGCMSHSALS